MNTIKDFLNSTLCVIVIYKVKLNESPSFVSILKILNEQNLTLDFLIYDNIKKRCIRVYKYTSLNT